MKALLLVVLGMILECTSLECYAQNVVERSEVKGYQSEICIFEYFCDSLDLIENNAQTVSTSDEPTFIKVEVMPWFMGGDLNTFRSWVIQEFKTSAIAAEKGILGIVVVAFIIEKDGHMSNIEFLHSPDPAYNEELMRIFNKAPKWTTGYHKGIPVRVQCVLPIIFTQRKYPYNS